MPDTPTREEIVRIVLEAIAHGGRTFGNHDAGYWTDQIFAKLSSLKAIEADRDYWKAEAAGNLRKLQRVTEDLKEARAALAVCRESLADQSAVRPDPTMPVLIPEVVEALEADVEANYAMAENAEERRNAHGLSLLVEWQKRARLKAGEGNGERDPCFIDGYFTRRVEAGERPPGYGDRLRKANPPPDDAALIGSCNGALCPTCDSAGRCLYTCEADRLEARAASQPQEQDGVDLAGILAQLRHAYAHLAAERVTKQREFADGLIAPQIRKLEALARRAGGGGDA